VGEWASQEGNPTPNLHAALGDAAWLTGLERNSDIVILESYAPLLVNINPGAAQWGTNLIGYNALQSYNSPSYYVQSMFSNHHGNVVLPTTLNTTGTSRVYASVTHDRQKGTVVIKAVNVSIQDQPLNISLNGINRVSSGGTSIVLSGFPSVTNAIGDPNQAVPVTSSISGVSSAFSYDLPPYSVTVLELKAR
jgi:alpha-N-arabinofuranosidase